LIAKPDPLIHPITRLSVCGFAGGHLAWLAQLEEAVSASARDYAAGESPP